MVETNDSDSPMMTREEEKLKRELRAILISAGSFGLTIGELEDDYRDLTGIRLPLLGFSTSEELIRSLPDVIYVDDRTEQPILLAVSDRTTEHLEQLVAEQRPSYGRRRFGGILSKDQLLQKLKTNVLMILMSRGSMSLDRVIEEYRSRYGDLNMAKDIFGCSMKEALQHKLHEIIQVRHADDEVYLSLHEVHRSPLDRTTSLPMLPSTSTSPNSSKSHKSGIFPLPPQPLMAQQGFNVHVPYNTAGPSGFLPYDSLFPGIVASAPPFRPYNMAGPSGYYLPYNRPPFPNAPPPSNLIAMQSMQSAMFQLPHFVNKILAILKVSAPKEFNIFSLSKALTELYGVSPNPVIWGLTWEQVFTNLPSSCQVTVNPHGAWTIRFIEQTDDASTSEQNDLNTKKNGFSRFPKSSPDTEQRAVTKDQLCQTSSQSSSSTVDQALIEKIRFQCNTILDDYPIGICFPEFKKVFKERTKSEFPSEQIGSDFLFGPSAVIWFSHRRCRDGWPLVISAGKQELTNLPPDLQHGLHCLVYWVLYWHPNGLTESELRQLLQDYFGVVVDQDKMCVSLLDMTEYVNVHHLGQGDLLVYLQRYDDEESCISPLCRPFVK